ncbi:MAG: histidine ammonia-lyase, partial [Thermoplasmata archaeon]|nr:histidine ammonia-lyase [Thermoplasmata archaeon]
MNQNVGTVVIDGNSLTIDMVKQVARGGAKVTISRRAKEAIVESRKRVEEIIESGRITYGIQTGFGELCNVRISDKDIENLQRNLIVSDVCGVGRPLSEDVVRAVMLLRANALAKGYSGCRPVIVDTLIEMLNKGVHPVIPEKGSVGASGDLAPLAHMALVMLGEGEAIYNSGRFPGGDADGVGTWMPGRKAMKKAGIEPVVLKAKEGLSLINGTQLMTAIGALACYDASKLLDNAIVVGAMSLEALQGNDSAFHPILMEARPHIGIKEVAGKMRQILQGSERLKKGTPLHVQDAYSIRCIPQVLGSVLDTLNYAKGVLEIEMNSATDNPIIILGHGGKSCGISGGNFHGEPVALAMDFLKIALAEIGNISERRTARLMDSKLSGLPPFLTKDSGLNNGFMVSQYTAAALASENKILCHPASIDSIPTSANQEDHVSMG